MFVAIDVCPAQDAKVLEVENIVQTSTGSPGAWVQAAKDQSLAISDRIRTRQRSRAMVRLTDLYTIRLDQFTTRAHADAGRGNQARARYLRGAGFIFSRETGGEIGIKTPAANAALRGTQFSFKSLPTAPRCSKSSRGQWNSPTIRERYCSRRGRRGRPGPAAPLGAPR